MTGEAAKVQTVRDFVDWLKHVNNNFEELDLRFIPDDLLNMEMVEENKRKSLDGLNRILLNHGSDSREAQFIGDLISVVEQ